MTKLIPLSFIGFMLRSSHIIDSKIFTSPASTTISNLIITKWKNEYIFAFIVTTLDYIFQRAILGTCWSIFRFNNVMCEFFFDKLPKIFFLEKGAMGEDGTMLTKCW